MKINKYIELASLFLRLLKNKQINAKKIINLFENFASLLFRTKRAGKMPSAIIIEPVNYCNLKCRGCGFAMCGQVYDRQKMSVEKFKTVFDEVKEYIFFLVLENGGEPFLNKDLLKMVKYAYDCRVPTITSTNADFKTGDNWGEKIVDSCLDTLIISISGHNNETHGDYHKNGNFNRVMENVKKIVEAKNRLNSNSPELILRFIETKNNEFSVGFVKNKFKKWGFNKIDVRKTNTEQFLFKRSLNNEIKIAVVGEGKKIYPNFCADLYFIPDILVDGTVFPCCFTYLFPPKIGNVFQDGGMKKIWNNANYKKMRMSVLNNRMGIPACSVCNGSFGYSGDNWNRPQKFKIYTPYH